MMTTLDIGGPWFEELQRGLEYDAPAITVTAGHAALYQALFADRLRLPLDHESARAVTRSDAPLAHPLLAVNIVIGQTTWATQRVKGNLFYRGLLLERPVHLGDTLYTRTRIVGARQNRSQPGRAATGVILLEVTTLNQRQERVLHFWRAPMIPCRDPQAATGLADDLDAVGASPDAEALRSVLPPWNLGAFPRSLRAASPVPPATRLRIESRDTITSAPELARMTLNMAMAHTDARFSHLSERLVYGGHVFSMAFAQVTRVLPDLVTLLAWERCDHLAPAIENDCLRTELTLLERIPLPGGAIVKLHVESFAARAANEAARGVSEEETKVLDWTFFAWSL